jgi:transcriptional regulator with XRE-family HTH domain
MGRLVRVVGANVRHYRQAAGLTQKVLAQRVGVTIKTLSSIEGGHRSPALGLLEKCAAGLGIEPWQLLDVDQRAAVALDAVQRSDMAGLPVDAREAVARIVTLLRKLPSDTRRS